MISHESLREFKRLHKRLFEKPPKPVRYDSALIFDNKLHSLQNFEFGVWDTVSKTFLAYKKVLLRHLPQTIGFRKTVEDEPERGPFSFVSENSNYFDSGRDIHIRLDEHRDKQGQREVELYFEAPFNILINGLPIWPGTSHKISNHDIVSFYHPTFRSTRRPAFVLRPGLTDEDISTSNRENSNRKAFGDTLEVHQELRRRELFLTPPPFGDNYIKLYTLDRLRLGFDKAEVT
jgi:hypothetical protein